MNKLQLLHENKERKKFVCLFTWLDTKLEITEDKSNCIDKTRLEKHIIFNYFEFFDFESFNSKNIDFVKQVLKVYFMSASRGATGRAGPARRQLGPDGQRSGCDIAQSEG